MRGAAVFFGPEVGERQIEPHPRQGRVTDQHGAEPGDGGLPILSRHRDRAVKEIQVVCIPFSRLDALEQELRIIQFTLSQRCPGGFDQGFGGKLRTRCLLRYCQSRTWLWPPA